jgi:hypothetical protein
MRIHTLQDSDLTASAQQERAVVRIDFTTSRRWTRRMQPASVG